MPFKFIPTRIPDVLVMEPQVFSDPRGFFMELFKSSEFQKNGIPATLTQVSHSRSQKNVVRGLHYQLHPQTQSRIVRVIHGEIFDVAVDIRRGSPTYGQWVAERLSATNHKMLFIPEGFAHGLCALSDEAEILYFCNKEYAPERERIILWNDREIGIAWPVDNPVLSLKDTAAPLLSAAENNL